MRREARQRREETRKDKDRVEKASVGDTGVIGGAVEEGGGGGGGMRRRMRRRRVRRRVTGSSERYLLRLTKKKILETKLPPENVECPQYLLPRGLER